MKATIKIYQESEVLTSNLAAFESSIEFHHATGNNKVIGTLVSEFFKFHSFYNEIGAKAGNGKFPYLVVVESNGIEVLHLGKLSRIARNKFKLQNTAKSRKRFALRLSAVLNLVTSKVTVQTVEELVNSFE